MEKVEYRNIHTNKGIDRIKDRVANSSMSARQKAQIEKYILDSRIGKKSRKKVGDRRLGSYLQFIIYLSDIFKKDLDTLTDEETTRFYTDLQDNKIKKQNGMPYAVSVKDMYTRTLKDYLGWVWGRESKNYKVKLKWMKEDYKKSNKNAILYEDCLKIVAKEKYIRNRALIMFLFDSGGRIEEVLNVRIGDLSKGKKKDDEKDEFFMVHIRGQKTENADRTISLPLSTKYLNDWLKEHPTGKDEDFIFPINYDNARKIIREASKRALGFILKPHELRHSSATFYVQKFGAENIGGFYYRLGWKFGSDEANTYIKQYLFAGEIGQRAVVKAVDSDKMQKLEGKNEELENKMNFLLKALTTLQEKTEIQGLLLRALDPIFAEAVKGKTILVDNPKLLKKLLTDINNT